MDVSERAHQNFCDFTRFHARLDPAAHLLDESGIVAVAGSADFPAARSAIRSDRSLDVVAWADAVTAFFDAHGKTGCVFARVGADDDLHEELTSRKFHEWAQTPEMVCDRVFEAREPPDGVGVRFASSPDDVTAYARIAGEAFVHLSIPADLTRDEIDNADVFLGADCVIALADIDGEPVAGASAMLFGEQPLGYVGWVACLDSARGRGLGEVVTRAVTNEAFARGSQLVTLEASQFGESTYARMGYREIYRYRVLLRL